MFAVFSTQPRQRFTTIFGGRKFFTCRQSLFAQKHAENVKKSKFQGIISSSELLRTTNSQNLLGTSNTFYAQVFAHILEVNDNLRTRKNAMKEALIQTDH